jgi:HK97 family phage portal protein
MERRGLFETIFGKKKQPDKEYSQFKLLNSYQTQFIPFSGNAWDVDTVRAAVHSFARRAAVIQPQHIRYNGGRIDPVRDEMNYIMQYRPNPYSTAYKFYYRLATQYKLYNNVFIYPVFDEKAKLSAMYIVNANQVELLEAEGILFCRFSFASGKKYVLPYTEIIHVGSMFNENDIFGSENRAIGPVLDTANTFNQSMAKLAELVAIIRGILEVQTTTKNEDLKSRRDEFVRDNLQMENNGSGVIVTDNKYKYTPINDKQQPIPTGQLDYVKTEVYDYFGTNEKIVQNKATPEEEGSFYDGELKPFFAQLQQAFTNILFTDKERGYGNEIRVEGNKLQFASTQDKLAVCQYLSNIGALELDQALTTLGFPAIGGTEGKRRVQTLNVVNADKADEYQLGSGKNKDKDKDEDDKPKDNDNEEDEKGDDEDAISS